VRESREGPGGSIEPLPSRLDRPRVRLAAREIVLTYPRVPGGPRCSVELFHPTRLGALFAWLRVKLRGRL
jgi:hypothetical protein